MRRALMGSLVTLAVLAGCGGSDDDGASGGEDSTEEVTGGTERPEGPWTFVRTQLERSDAPDLPPGLSEVRLTALEPSCESGPCDVEGTPAGADGTYYPEGYTVVDPPAPQPETLTWDATAEEYTITSAVETVGCTTVELERVEDAYELQTTATLTFVPPEGGAPASLVGTYEQSVTSTPAGAAAGCTPYEESGSVVASPTGALDGSDLQLEGEYETTEIVEVVEPAGQRPPGVAGLLPRMSIEGAGDDLVITGILDEPATLTQGEAGAGGSTDTVSRPCTLETEVADGFTSQETWTDLAPVALTADGDLILAGRWRIEENPTEVGVDAGCSFSTNTGYIVMVPVDAVG